MKYIKFLLILIVFTACKKLSTYEFVVTNSTEHLITIEAFYNGIVFSGGIESEVIKIKPYESYTNIVLSGPEDNTEIGIFKTNLIDSVNIIFDDQRIIIQSCQETYLEFCTEIQKIFYYGRNSNMKIKDIKRTNIPTPLQKKITTMRCR